VWWKKVPDDSSRKHEAYTTNVGSSYMWTGTVRSPQLVAWPDPV